MQAEVWDDVKALERRMDDLFRGFLGPRARAWFPEARTGLRWPFVPVTDVFARNGDLVVRTELPGIDPNEVDLTIQDGVLVIHGERKLEEELKEENFYRMEASYGTFGRHIPLPKEVDEKRIAAEYRDGILEIVVPAGKTETPKQRRIPIRFTAKA